MRKWLPWIIVLLLILWIGTLHQTNTQTVKSRVDTIKIKEIEILNDSIITIIDSSNTKIQYINNWYEKELVNITNQSIASDVEFFTNYLETKDCK